MNDSYDLIVIGGGAAGLTAAGFGGRINAKVALVEKARLGGECTWTGCVPSKALLKVSKIAHAVRTAGQYGIAVGEPRIDMAQVRSYVQTAISGVYQHETPEVFSERYNVEVIPGAAQFVDENTVQVEDRIMRADRFIIATGATPRVPQISGLESAEFLTNETIFTTDRQFERLLIIGGGPVGIEMAQAHARLGIHVTVVDDDILGRDEPEAVELLRAVLQEDGVEFAHDKLSKIHRAEKEIVATLTDGKQVTGDAILLAVGRTPVIQGLGLESACIQFDESGIVVDKHLRTTTPHIYAVGDCTPGPKFTHYAGFQGSVAARNALLPIVKSRGHAENIPWVTFTDPEIAQVGMTEAQAREVYGNAVKVYRFSMQEGDRAVTENDTSGFIKIVYKGSNELLGVTIVAERAGEMLVEFSYIIEDKLSFRDVIDVMHAYPTYSDITRKAIANLMVEEVLSGTTGKLIDMVTGFLF